MVVCSCRTPPLPTGHKLLSVATECGFEILPRPPYSPDITPSDFYLFPTLKSHFHATQYGSNMKASFRQLTRAYGTRKRLSISKGQENSNRDVLISALP